jgi:hypothetical protein
MTNQHSLTPPPELVQQWMYESNHNDPIIPQLAAFAALAAQWGADVELDECCELVSDSDGYDAALTLRATRRPQPPSLKERALESVKRFEESGEFFLDQMCELAFIRKAIEALPND